LSTGVLIVGGCWAKSYQPDIGFKDRHISKMHASIVYSDGQFVLTDVHSTKGTRINGNPMTQGMPYVLRNDDRISLADGVVMLRFCQKPVSDEEQTMTDIDKEAATVGGAVSSLQTIVVNDQRKEVLVEGKQLLKGDSLEYRLLLLLYRNLGRAVGYDAMKEWVWPDRKVTDPDSGRTTYDVDLNEIEQVVYRLRRRLDKYADCVQNVPRCGYMLSLV